MFRRPARPSLAVAVALGLALPAVAPAEEMTPEARAALRAEIRAYLLENPEVIFEAVAEFERRTAAAQAEMDTALVEINAAAIFADGHSWVGGNPEGDVVLVEFMDYRCSFCRRAFPEMMAFVEEDGQVRLVIKELPILGPASETMSRFAIATLIEQGPDTYFRVHEALLALQGEPTQAVLAGIAAELGFDPGPVLAAMGSARVDTILTENRRLAQRLQISGTPSFVMGDGAGGQMLRGMVPADRLHETAAALRG
jgi:protein-disulfide isomerase